MTSPLEQISSQPPPLGQRSVQPAVSLHVARQAPPSHVVSQLPVPLQTISDPIPTWNEHACVLLHVAVQSTPHADVQPPVPVQATAQ